MPYRSPDQPPRAWCLLSGQGLVLAMIARAPEATLLRMARRLHYAPGRVRGIIRELENAALLTRARVGRQNHYTLNAAANARIPGLPSATVGDVLCGVQRQSEEAS